MIKTITGGRYVTVSNGSAPSTYINNYGGAQGVGNMRFNTTNQSTEVFDGNSWITINGGYASVELSGEAQMLLDYVRQLQGFDVAKKFAEIEAKDRARQRLIAEHPQLAKAYEAIKRAEDNFEVFAKFVENDAPESAETTQSP